MNETGGQAKLEITIIKGREPALSTSVSLADKNTKKLLRIKVNTTNNLVWGYRSRIIGILPLIMSPFDHTGQTESQE